MTSFGPDDDPIQSDMVEFVRSLVESSQNVDIPLAVREIFADTASLLQQEQQQLQQATAIAAAATDAEASDSQHLEPLKQPQQQIQLLPELER